MWGRGCAQGAGGVARYLVPAMEHVARMAGLFLRAGRLDPRVAPSTRGRVLPLADDAAGAQALAAVDGPCWMSRAPCMSPPGACAQLLIDGVARTGWADRLRTD